MTIRIRSRNRALGAAALFLAVFGVFAWACSPHIGYEDSGELVTAAYRLGVTHPPGNPAYPLLSRPVLSAPVGSPAFRAALGSAWFTGLGVLLLTGVAMLLCHGFLGLGIGMVPPAVLALFWPLSAGVLAQGTVPEVYPAAVCVMLLVVWLVMAHALGGDRRLLLLGLLVLGLGIALHPSMVFALVPVALFGFLIGPGPARFRPSRSMVLVLVFLAAAGGLIYAYLPLRAGAGPVLNWGAPDTASSFLNHTTGVRLREWAALNRNPVLADYLLFAAQAPAAWVRQLGWLPGILVLWGLATRGRNRAMAALLVSGAAGVLGMILLAGDEFKPFTVHTHSRLYLPALALVFPLACAGGADLWLRLRAWFRSGSILSGLAACAVLAGLAALPMALGGGRRPLYDRRPHELAARMLHDAPAHGVLLVGNAVLSFPILYLSAVEGRFDEARVFDLDGNVFHPLWAPTGRFSVEEYERALEAVKRLAAGDAEVYSVSRFAEDRGVFDFEPHGWVYRVRLAGEGSEGSGSGLGTAALPSFESRLGGGSYPERELQGYYHLRRAEALVLAGDRHGAVRELELSGRVCGGVILCQAMRLDFALRFPGYMAVDGVIEGLLEAEPNNALGLLYQARRFRAGGRFEPAVEHYRRALARRPDRDSVRLELAETLVEYGERLMVGNPTRAVERLLEAVETVETPAGAAERAILARAYHHLWRIELDRGRTQRAEEYRSRFQALE